MDETYIVLGQEVEGTEELIVIKLETLGRLQSLQVVDVCRRLWDLLGTALCLVVSVRILRRDPRTPAATSMVVVWVRRDV
jgi:hypothetical protein